MAFYHVLATLFQNVAKPVSAIRGTGDTKESLEAFSAQVVLYRLSDCLVMHQIGTYLKGIGMRCLTFTVYCRQLPAWGSLVEELVKQVANEATGGAGMASPPTITGLFKAMLVV